MGGRRSVAPTAPPSLRGATFLLGLPLRVVAGLGVRRRVLSFGTFLALLALSVHVVLTDF